jgi:hypothetical protein
METVLEECTVTLFLWAKGLNVKDIHKEMFPIYDLKRLSHKAFHSWVEKFSEGRSRVADDETELRKWLKQQSKSLYAVGFDALVSDGTSVSMLVEDVSRNKCFSHVRISHVLRFKSICDIITDTTTTTTTKGKKS